MKFGIQLLRNEATGEVMPAGTWLAAYDPNANAGRGHVQLTRNPGLAKRFDSHAEAWECYHQIATNRARRPDGRPNKPLTAFTISIERLE